jgi:SAM-dependent methyltransferase
MASMIAPLDKPFSPASERNREPILAVLRSLFADRRRVLEIGSGTGQHAVYFAAHLPHLQWQTSDLPENHPGIKAWLDDAQLPNLLPPLSLDAAAPAWPAYDWDAVFTANTCHIMSWEEVEAMFAGIGRGMPPGGRLAIYGPFNYGGRFTGPGNARFDTSLRAADPHRGIRDFEAIDALARRQGLRLTDDIAMPADNRLLAWQKPVDA